MDVYADAVSRSYEHYDETAGISAYRSPSVQGGRVHVCFDPLSELPEEGRRLRAEKSNHKAMVEDAEWASGFAEFEIAKFESYAISSDYTTRQGQCPATHPFSGAAQ